MQIDLLIYGKKPWIAIEVDGIQHETRQYFQTEQEFQYLQECDKIKEWQLKDKGIILIKVNDKCQTLDDFKELLKEQNVLLA